MNIILLVRSASRAVFSCAVATRSGNLCWPGSSAASAADAEAVRVDPGASHNSLPVVSDAVPDLHIAPEVSELLGPEGVDLACSPSPTGRVCTMCSVALDVTEPASVLALHSSRHITVAYAHPRCSPSRAVPVGEDYPGRSGRDEPMDIHLLTFTTDLRGQQAALLLAEIPSKAHVRSAGGDLTDAFVSGLLHLGFTLMMSFDQRPAELAHWVAAVLPVGTTATSADGDPVLGFAILDAQGSPFFAGTMAISDEWISVARTNGSCVLHYGSTTLYGTPRDVTAYRAGLDKALADGQLVGARIPFRDLRTASPL